MDAAITTFCEAVDVGSINSGDEADFFKNLFPENYETKIISYHFNDYECTGGTCHARIALRTKEDFIEWLDHHQRKSGIVYRLRRTRRSDGKYCLYKADYRCQHNTLAHYNKSKNPSKKHTLCPAKLSVTIKTAPRKTRSKDAYLKCYPAVIHINHVHNHPIHITEQQQSPQRPPVAIIKQKYLSLLKVNRTPVQPGDLQQSELMEVQDNYFDGVTQLGQQEGPNVNWIYLPNVDKIDELNLQSIQGSDIYEISEVKNSGQSTTYVVNMKNEGIPIDPEGRTIRLVASGANGEQYELHMENNNDMGVNECAGQLIGPDERLKEEEELDDDEKTSEAQDEAPHYIQQLEFLFMNIVEDVKIHYNNNPEEFNLAIQSACNNYHNITTESALLSALTSFGKHIPVARSTTTVTPKNICVLVQNPSEETSMLKTEELSNSHHNTVVIDFNEHCYAKNKNIV